MHLTGRLVALTLEGALLLVLIACAAYVSMGRILLANIDTFREQIEDRASTALNVPVTLDEIGGTWEYLDPTLTLSGIRLGEDVWIGDVSARVNSLESFLERGIVLTEVTVDDIDMHLMQLPDGSWQVKGLPQGGGGFDASPVIRSLPHLKKVELSGVDVRVDGQRRQYHLRNQDGTPMLLIEEGDDKLVSMPLSFQRSAENFSEFELVGRYRGDPRKIDTFFADLYLQLPKLELSDFLPRPESKWLAEQLGVRGEFWLEAANGEWEFRAKPFIDSFAVSDGTSQVEILSDFSAVVVLAGATTANISGQVTDIGMTVSTEQFEFEPIEIALRENGNGNTAAARIPAIDLEETARIADYLTRALGLVDENGVNALAELNPRGQLGELHAVARWRDDQVDWRVASRVVDVSVDSHRNSPIVEGLSGILALDPAGGYLDLVDDSFGITFPPAYEEVSRFDKGAGRLAFGFSEGYPRITSDMIRVRQGNMSAAGKLEIDLRAEREERTWTLELGVLEADLLSAQSFVPNNVDQGLREWLARGVKGGTSLKSGLVFTGTLDRTAPDGSKIFELYFDVADTTLEYDPAWPAVEDMNSVIYVSNRGVFSGEASGTMLDSSFVASVAVPMSRSMPPSGVLIEGDVSGGLLGGLRMLQETPLAEETGYLASQWVGEGVYSGRVKINVPIGPREGEPVDADVSISLDGNSIKMGDLDLMVEDINSTFSYSPRNGLYADKFSATLFGNPVTGDIKSEVTTAGGAVLLSFGGLIGAEELQVWSGQELLRSAQGYSSYDAVLSVPYGDRAAELAYVEAVTDLEGFTVNLPPPLGKPAGEPRHFVYRQSFLDEGFSIDMQLDEVFRASLKSSEQGIEGGAVRFGDGPLGAVAYDNLDVFGQLDFADYARWEEAAQYFESEDGEVVEVAGLLDAVEVDIRSLVAFGVELESVSTRITRDPGQWNVELENTMLKGEINVPDSEEPIRIALDYLRMPESEEPEGYDPLEDIEPRELTVIDFETAEFKVGEEDYGQWAFRFVPTPYGGMLENVNAEVRGLSVGGNSAVEWIIQDDGVLSRYQGDIGVADLASAFEQWGFASSVEGKDLKLNADLSWAGSPAMIDLYNVSGPLEIQEGSGRFVQAESGTGALRLLGVFDFASLARRFRFDFSDVVNSGFSFSELNGRVRFNEGIVKVTRPVEIVGSGSKFKVGGTVDLYTNALDNDMIVTLPVSRNLPWYAAYSAIVTGPLVGAGVWLANKIFENQIDQMSSAKYKIEGTIDEPVIEFVSIFNDSVREAPEEPPAEGVPATTSVTSGGPTGSEGD